MLTSDGSGALLRGMRKLVLVVGLVVAGAGCRTTMGLPRVEVPNTPEGLACQRECLLIFHSCQAGGRRDYMCRIEQLRALRTCPGATQDDLPIELDPVTRY